MNLEQQFLLSLTYLVRMLHTRRITPAEFVCLRDTLETLWDRQLTSYSDCATIAPIDDTVPKG